MDSSRDVVAVVAEALPINGAGKRHGQPLRD
jgi:hypothetical protein